MAEEIDVSDLVVRYLDGALTPEEQRRLNDLLRTDPAQRRRFVEASLQAAMVREVVSRRRAAEPPARTRRRWAVGAGAALAVAAAVVLFLVRPREGAVPPNERVAIVSRAEGAVWARGSLPVEEGRVLGRGRIELRAGKARIDFFGGAQVLLAAPAVLELVSPRRGFLHSGQVSARVHDQAVGFVLGAPGAKVFDLGTEFALAADPAGRSDVQVFEGEVEASVLGPDGTTLESTIVGADRRLLIDPAARAIREEPGRGAGLERLAVIPPAPLAVPRAYVEAVLAARPVGYWRFERLEDGRVPNEVGPAHPLEAHEDVALAGGPDGRFAWFRPEARDRALSSDEIPGLGQGDFSMELWVNADSIREMSLAQLVGPERLADPDWLHLALLELRALEGRFSHAPGAIRYLHRWPPGPRGGVNVFSAAPYRPGVWHHLAGVSQGETMSLYVDGRLIGAVPVPATRAPIPMRLVLGILVTHNRSDRRRLIGGLDEVALYDRALGPEEIAARVRLARGP